MDRSSKLIPSKVKAMCDAAIKMLNEDSEKLKSVTTSVDSFVSNDKIKSAGFNSLKNQMSNFQAVINLLQSANQSDIEACNQLSSMVGDEELDGAKLIDQLEEAKKSIEANKQKVEQYTKLLSEAPPSDGLYAYHSRAINDYQQLVKADEEIIKEIEKKMEFFDEVDAKSSSLFEAGAALRSSAMGAISDISTGSYIETAFGCKSYVVPKCEYICENIEASMKKAGYEDLSADAVDVPENQMKLHYKDGDCYIDKGYDYEKLSGMTKGEGQCYIKGVAEGEYAMAKKKVGIEILGQEGSVTQNVLGVNGEAAMNFSIGNDEEGNWNPAAKVEVEAGASLYGLDIESEVCGGAANATLSGDLISADASFEAGFEKDANGQWDVGLGGEAMVSLATGEASLDFEICGLEVEVGVEGHAGAVGIEGELGYEDGKFSGEIGMAALFGGGVNFSIGKAN